MFQQGAWLAGCGEPDAPLQFLSDCHDYRGLALAGRLWLVYRHDPHEAAKAFRAIESPTISLQPQVIFERDKVLIALGRTSELTGNTFDSGEGSALKHMIDSIE